jgi:predicted small secreted protein
MWGDTAALVVIVALWALFFAGCYTVHRAKKSGKY